MAEDTAGATLRVKIEQTAPVPLAVDFAVGRNELLALVGPSGAGKTTVLRSIAGLMRPAAGEISANGETWFSSSRAIDLAPQTRAVGLVFQDYALFPHLTALENVAIAVKSVAKEERTERARALERRQMGKESVVLEDQTDRARLRRKVDGTR
jgi:molybdate transport system ATP-binding protein